MVGAVYRRWVWWTENFENGSIFRDQRVGIVLLL